jgi:type IV pilus assembly protein PilB
VAGSYGSEKSGLIYSALKYLNNDEINITTVEDTVKYRLDGINQIHLAPSNGLDPVSAIQCCISQDTQVLATDEIRNKDEVGELFEAARTGHLVVAGINANNVFQAILRLFRMGLNSGDFLPLLLGVMATCNARKLCPQCKEKYRASKEEIKTYFDTEGEFKINLYKPKGCQFCNDTGYSGRIALHELLILNNKFKKLVHSDITLMSLTESAEKENFQSMRYDGMKKVLRGLTTFDEINRVTMPQL